jgi:hypothetical protein
MIRLSIRVTPNLKLDKFPAAHQRRMTAARRDAMLLDDALRAPVARHR